MIKIIWDQGFKRVYKRKVKNNDEYKKKFWDAFEIFSKDPFDPQLKTQEFFLSLGEAQGIINIIGLPAKKEKDLNIILKIL